MPLVRCSSGSQTRPAVRRPAECSPRCSAGRFRVPRFLAGCLPGHVPAADGGAHSICPYGQCEKPEREYDRGRFPSLARTKLLMTDGPFTELAATGPHPLTLVTFNAAREGIVWIPGDAAGLYIHASQPARSSAARHRRPVDATTSVMQQGTRTLLHLINLSGHMRSAYHSPAEMRGIEVEVEGQILARLSGRCRFTDFSYVPKQIFASSNFQTGWIRSAGARVVRA